MSFVSTPHSVLFFEGTSYHARPGHWKFEEQINMLLSELHLEESNDGSVGALSYTGRVPDSVFPTMPPGAIEFRGLTCPIPFHGCLALTVPPSKNKDGSAFHYSPVSLLIFYKTQRDGGKRVVHHNLETISWKGVKGNYSFAPQEEFLLTIFDERYLSMSKKSFRGKRKTFRPSVELADPSAVKGTQPNRNRRGSMASEALDAATLAHLQILSERMRHVPAVAQDPAKSPSRADARDGGKRGSIPFPRDGLRRSVSGRTVGIGRTVKTSPLISGDALAYAATTTVHRDKSLTVDLRLRNTEQPPRSPAIFHVRLRLRPCAEGAVVRDARHAARRTTRRVAVLFARYCPVVMWRLAEYVWRHEVKALEVRPARLVSLILMASVLMHSYPILSAMVLPG